MTVVLALAAVAASSAPVLGSEESTSLATPREHVPPSAHLGTAPASALRTLDRSLTPETSTGNKNLDLLLDLKVRPGEAARPAAPRLSAAAASAAAAELAVLRAKAAQKPATTQDEQAAGEVTTRQGLSLQPFEGLGTLHGDVRAGPSDPVQRRGWSGQFGGGAEGAADGGPGRASNADDDNPARRFLRDMRQFLREHGLSLLGAVGGLALLGAALKAYSRRP